MKLYYKPNCLNSFKDLHLNKGNLNRVNHQQVQTQWTPQEQVVE
jgi:hypothetical protein